MFSQHHIALGSLGALNEDAEQFNRCGCLEGDQPVFYNPFNNEVIGTLKNILKLDPEMLVNMFKMYGEYGDQNMVEYGDPYSQNVVEYVGPKTQNVGEYAGP